jgi:gliding motility-associated-like protein
MTITGIPTISGTFNYTLTLTGGCGAGTATGTIIVSAGFTASTVVTNVLCFGSSTGAIDLTLTGGTAPFTYLWSNGATTQNISGLTAGTYTVTITDAVCSGNASATVTQPVSALTVSTTQTDVLCYGNSTGNATVTPAGGTSPYSYSWNTLPVQTNATATGLAAGTYTVTVTDNNLCSTSANVTINQPSAAITGSASITTAVPCNGGTATVTLTGAGGTAPLSYTFNGVTNATGVFSGISAGVGYAWSITDANTCTPVTGIIDVTEPAVISGSAAVTSAIACNGSTATITMTGSGGTTPLSYTFNGMTNATGVFSGVPAGAGYLWSITDANNCVPVTGSLAVTEPSALSGSITSQTDVSVFGGNDGSVTVAGSGGTAPYEFKLDTSAYQVSGTFSSLTAGTFTVTVQDTNFCTVTVSVTITQPLLALSGIITSQTNVLCFGDSTGSVTVSGINGLPPYKYSIDGVDYRSSGTFDTLKAGSYTVTVRDSLLSTFNVPVAITQPDSAISIVTSEIDAKCSGSSTGSATAIVSGGTSPYIYAWSTSPVQATATATSLKAGAYTVTVKDANGCTSTAGVTVAQPSVLTVNMTKTDVLCNGGATGTSTAVPSGGIPPYTFLWTTSPAQTTATATGLEASAYSVTVTDSNSCAVTGDITIAEPSAISLTASTTDETCPDAHDGSISLAVSGGVAPYKIIWWDGADSLSRRGLDSSIYSVVVTDTNGCAKSLSVEVKVEGNEKCLFIPQIITPNNDGFNDVWMIKNIDLFPNAELFIYTRWGKLIYHSKNIAANPWDGRYRGELMPTDSYHYILFLGNGSNPRSGIISVIR